MDKELPDQKGTMLAMYDELAFGRDVIEKFREIVSPENDPSLLHVHMTSLADAVRDALSIGDLAQVRKVCDFIEAALAHSRCIAEIPNAVALSFVQLEEFRQIRASSDAVEQLPPRLLGILAEQETRDGRITSGSS